MSQIIPTKILIPPLNGNPIPRAHLLDRLSAGYARGNVLTLVSAFAGSGKTTLISSWLKENNFPAAWVSLDSADNDPTSFWRYITAAFQTLEPVLGLSIQAAFDTLQDMSLEAVVQSVIEDLTRFGKPSILVLDDYHAITNSAVHASVSCFLERLPPKFHLVISTREDPPFPLSRLRASLRISEFRYGDLRFNADEAGQLLNDRMDTRLSEEEILMLQERTEGWAAGLQLAALSLFSFHPSDRFEFIQTFAGDDRYVFDYLMEVVLMRQPPELRDFLFKTSILDRLCPSLCSFMLDVPDSSPLLARLESQNLFIFSLDNRRVWYRYHHLFSDLLRHRLSLVTARDERITLYRKAILWHEKQGLFSEALQYALSSQQYDIASDLVERNIWSTYYRSETQLLYSWLKALPEECLRARPLLSAAYANCLLLVHRESMHAGQYVQLIDSWLNSAETLLAESSQLYDPRITHYIDKIRIYFALFRNADPHELMALSLSGLARLPAHEVMFRSAMTYSLGHACVLLNNTAGALDAFRQAVDYGEQSHDLFNMAGAVERIADLLYRQGSLLEAVAICRDGLAKVEKLAGGRMVPYTGSVQILLGSVLTDLGFFTEAEAALTTGQKLLHLTYSPASQQKGYVTLAYILASGGKTPQALEALMEAKNISSLDGTIVDAHRARLLVLAAENDIRHLIEADKWLEKQDMDILSHVDENNPVCHAIVRVRIAKHQYQSAGTFPWPLLEDYLDRQILASQKENCPKWQLEVLLLAARLRFIKQDRFEAMTLMEQALLLAEKHGFSGIFIFEGRQMARWLQSASSLHICRSLADHLLAAFPDLSVDNTGPSDMRDAEHGLHETLSQRELEVLRLMAYGAANSEIAARLVISVNTVKTHINHILNKLAASSRLQAVARARDLDLI